jgi:hypothetical protein
MHPESASGSGAGYGAPKGGGMEYFIVTDTNCAATASCSRGSLWSASWQMSEYKGNWADKSSSFKPTYVPVFNHGVWVFFDYIEWVITGV